MCIRDSEQNTYVYWEGQSLLPFIFVKWKLEGRVLIYITLEQGLLLDGGSNECRFRRTSQILLPI